MLPANQSQTNWQSHFQAPEHAEDVQLDYALGGSGEGAEGNHQINSWQSVESHQIGFDFCGGQGEEAAYRIATYCHVNFLPALVALAGAESAGYDRGADTHCGHFLIEAEEQ